MMLGSPTTDELRVSMTYKGDALSFTIESTDDVSLVIECLELLNRKRKLNNTENSLKNVEV